MVHYRPLRPAEAARLSEQLEAAARRLCHAQAPDERRVQQRYDEILSARPQMPEEEVQALGYAFGELLRASGWLDWAMLVDDEYGDEISLSVRERQLGCCPLSMIRNRLEEGEATDLTQLRYATLKRLRQLGQEAASAGPRG